MYIQKSSTAIGTVMAVVYAVIYIYKFEADIIASRPLKLVWWRFIDDIFAVWIHGDTKLLHFVAHLNCVKLNTEVHISVFASVGQLSSRLCLFRSNRTIIY